MNAVHLPARAADSPWFRRYSPRPAASMRLVCLPHAGGSAGFFRAWAALLPDSIELVAVQYPGREDRLDERPMDDMHALVDAIAQAMPVLLDRPYLLFGHSMGAAVAHELCLTLHGRRQRLPAHLVVSAREAPARHHGGTLHRAGEDALRHELRRLGGTPAALLDCDEFCALLLPRMRSDYRLIETYRPALATMPPLPLAISAFVGTDDHELASGDAEAWAQQTSQAFHLRRFAGDHFYLVPQMRQVVHAVLACAGKAATPADAWPSTP
ncbi:hypothetical protein ASG87_09300 [Frateuria sp. Soil773]|uniref:thioesterase II family protein n=1 Tax=Frateuria sp. Soil773 TaxID=1736407 RepID=UPI0006FA539A|nr:alpha/beta fold hydrolase [Frateuria sp. Soil773]KRE88754.1 hypothetical protein ASG87_09300 [Frateuria sp. Soil773]